MNSIILISSSDQIFVRELQENLLLNDRDVKTFITSNSHDFGGEVSSDIKINTNELIMKIPKIREIYLIYKIIKCLLKEKSKIINLHGVDTINSIALFLLSFISRKRIIITFYGSDFFRRKNKNIIIPIIKRADIITFTNEKMKDIFNEFYNEKYKEKLRVAKFGLKNLELIKEKINNNIIINKAELKKKFGIQSDKIVVTCGYAAIKEHQHEAILKEIKKINGELKQKITLVFPLTYGNDKKMIEEKIQNELQEEKIDILIIEEFLEGEKLVNFRMMSDIMLNLQTTDQFSGSMQEHIMGKNIVIAGKWLPYDFFIKEGLEIIVISKFEELSAVIEKVSNDIINKLEILNYEKNARLIWKWSSWKNTICQWEEIYTKK